MQVTRQDPIQGISHAVLLCFALIQIFTLDRHKQWYFWDVRVFLSAAVTRHASVRPTVSSRRCKVWPASSVHCRFGVICQPLWAWVAAGTWSRGFSCPLPHPVASPYWVVKCHLSLRATRGVTKPVSLISHGDLSEYVLWTWWWSECSCDFPKQTPRLDFSFGLEL